MATIEERRQSDGSNVFRVKVRLKGQPVQSASFRRLTDARRWAQSIEAAMREGRHFKSGEAKKRTLGEAIDRYIKEELPKKAKGGANQTAQFTWWRKVLGAYTLADVTAPRVTECRNRLLQEPKSPKCKEPDPDAVPCMRSPATVVRYMAALSHVFTIAIKEWGWADENPLAKIKKPKEPRGRERSLSDEERKRLLDACALASKPLHAIAVLALSTGMRRGEIMNLRWSQVDFDRKRITLYQTKNGEIRVLPLMGFAGELLMELSKVRKIDCDLVFFGTEVGRPFDIQKPWYSVLKAAQIEDFRFHDLRHSAASYLAMNGATLLEIAAVLGHKTLSMVKRYSHVGELHTAKVVESMNRRVFGHE